MKKLIAVLVVSGSVAFAADVTEVRVKALDGFGGDTSLVASRCQTKAGKPYDPVTVTHDVNSLKDSGEFEDITADAKRVASGVEVTFIVKRKMRFAGPLIVQGNDEFSESKVAKESELKDGYLYSEADLAAAEGENLAGPLLKRLKFDEKKLKDVLDGLDSLIALPDPLGKTTLARELSPGLDLFRVSCPIGVIGVIFESRPDALVQIASLCLKSGNAALLKGGREALGTNRALMDAMLEGAKGILPDGWAALLETRADVNDMLSQDGLIDLIIPRGSNAFVRYIMDHTRIPVMGHADGICHTYLDSTADPEKAVKVVTDAKTQYVSVCNATETLLVNRAVVNTILPKVRDTLLAKNVKIRCTSELEPVIHGEVIADDDFANEYLDYVIAVKAVDSVDEAIAHINRFGSHHTDAIITETPENADRFCSLVDSADVFVNCSTRFADGYRFGFGAEVGISTGKLHARGPVGLEGLVTYKYRLNGNGNIVADYAEGRKNFNFIDL